MPTASPPPTASPTIACSDEYPYLMRRAFFPDGASWADVVTDVSEETQDGDSFHSETGVRPDLAYDCISGGSHCFVLDYTYDASESEVRSAEITAGGGTVVSTLDGRKRYTY